MPIPAGGGGLCGALGVEVEVEVVAAGAAGDAGGVGLGDGIRSEGLFTSGADAGAVCTLGVKEGRVAKRRSSTLCCCWCTIIADGSGEAASCW